MYCTYCKKQQGQNWGWEENNIDIDYTNEANPFKIYLSGID
jgi:hypothetical protein